MENFSHLPVMLDSVLTWLHPVSGGTYLDGTLGGGGHSERILDVIGPDGQLIGLDRDQSALQAASARLQHFGNRFRAVHSSFGDMDAVLAELGISNMDGVLLDLGVSSHQLDLAERGFSFRHNGPLDMRMDPSKGRTAADVINYSSQAELERIIRQLGEERWARRIAQRIVQKRKEVELTSTVQLAEIVVHAIPARFHEDRIHPATRTFQAFRMEVNSELDQLQKGLDAGIELLKPGGRIAIITFHSLEDRIVKQTFKAAASSCICPPKIPVCTCGKKPTLKILTSRPIIASQAELNQNPRARSAKLRVAEKK